jgi:6-phosphogluconolactonase
VEIPRAFNVDATGRFLYASSLANGDLASYRIEPGQGTLTPLETYRVGTEPMWVLPLVLGE